MIILILAVLCCALAWLVLTLAHAVTGRDHDLVALAFALAGVAGMAFSFGAQS